jgi:hypothetical protein
MPTRLNAPYWGTSSQKFTFKTLSGSVFTCTTNPTTYTLDPGDNNSNSATSTSYPSSNAGTSVPAVLGPTIISGAMEYAPQAIDLEWAEFSETDYITLATSFNLQLGYMIDMNDRGVYGMLKIVSFDYAIGVAQRVGAFKAFYYVIGPANGLVSTVNVLSRPGTPTPTVSTGGSIPNATTTYYCYTWWTPWGETISSAIFSATTTAANQAVTIPFTFPTSVYFRRARLYAASSSAALAAGSTAYVMADVWTAFSPQWIDTTGINGLTNTATIPALNTAATGVWQGGLWINGS